MNNKAINIQQAEKVILFDGEEDFVISRGGNNSQYLMVDGAPTGRPQTATDTIGGSTDTAVGKTNTAVGDAATGGTPQSVSYVIPDWNSLDCTALNSAIASLSAFITANSANLPPTEVTYYGNELGKAKTLYRSKCTNANLTPPTYSVPDFSTMSCDTLKTELDKLKSWFSENQSKLDISGLSEYGGAIKGGNELYASKCVNTDIPKYEVPNWATLSCEQLKAKIDELGKYLTDYRSKLSANNAMFYDAALANADTIYTTKCKAAPAPTTTVTTTTSYIPSTFGGGFFGGGGRGGSANLGEKPNIDLNKKVTVQKKGLSNYWWLLLLVGVAGYVYYKNKEKKG